MSTDFDARRGVLRAAALSLPLLGGAGAMAARAAAAASPAPGQEWAPHASLHDAGFTADGIRAAEAALYPYETSSMMVVRAGRIAYTYGDVSTVSYLASARKSILSLLYGKYVAERAIDLDWTLGHLGIDDTGGLLPIEKTARIRDLLTARSGVYHAAGSPGSQSGAPERGSVAPGSRFVYNNWDFNLVGYLFEKLTGKTIFDSFHDDLAVPLQMQDVDMTRQRMLGFQPALSRYQAYHFFLSARDMARLGLLVSNEGLWNGKAVVPGRWIRDMTTLRVPARDTGPVGAGLAGYGYLWWKPDEARGAAWVGSSLAYGNYGQFILTLPALDMVVVHRRYVTDEFAIARNLGATPVDKTGVTAAQFMAVVDGFIAARS